MLYANLIALLLFLGKTNGYLPATVTAPPDVLGRSTVEEQFIGFGNQNGSGCRFWLLGSSGIEVCWLT
jgi:hypothetical protein